MENKELELRKQKMVKFSKDVINFLKDKKSWLQYLLLFLILVLAVDIRSQNWDLLKDSTTGKYISLELDSTLFLRYAQYIAEHGKLFDVDMMRNFPLGLDISFGVYTSYFVAYLYKILHIFIPSITVEFVDVIYPTIATVIATIFLFLFVRRLFDYKVALLSALFLVVQPTFLFRSMTSDHDILGLMLIFMTLYFFVVGWEAKRRRYNILFGVLAAVTSILGFNTAGNILIFFMIVSLFVIIHIILDNIKRSDLYVFPTWYVTTFIVLISSGRLSFNRFLSDYTGTLPANFAILSLVVYLLLDTKYLKDSLYCRKILAKIPKGFVSFLFAGIFSLLLLIIFLGFGYFVNIVNGFLGQFSASYLNTRWASTVAENKRVFVIEWFDAFGGVLFWLFIAGLILLLYCLFKNLKDYKKLFYVYSICILAFIFAKYSPNSQFNGSTPISKFMFYGSIILLAIYTAYYYMKNYYISNKLNNKFSLDLNWKYTLVLLMALVNVVGGTTAVRLFFELAPFVIIFSAFTLIFILDKILRLENKSLRYAGVLLLVLLLFSPFSFAKGIIIKDAKSSFDQAKFSGPGYNLQWQQAGKWVRENTPKDAVFNHWWDYGYWVQSGFERATVTDGGNLFGWWNYLTARNVLTAPNDKDALGFLYSHDVDYFLMIGDEVGKYPAYSLIGSDKNLDRYSFITLMGLDNSLSQETRNGIAYVYTGGFSLDEDLVVNEKIYPRGSVIAGVLIPFEKILDQNGNFTGKYNAKQPRVALVSGASTVELSIKCVYVDRLYTFENYDYGACVRIIPSVSGNNINNAGAIIFMSRKVADSLVGRLYILEQPSEYFKLVYNDSGNMPLALYNGRQIGPTKIWKIEYPEGFNINETERDYYTTQIYPDMSLVFF